MGPVSLGVSLPRAWVDHHRLRVGSPVQLRIATDGTLRLRARSRASTPGRRLEVTVAAPLRPEHLFRRLLGGYLAGATEFEIRESGGLSGATRSVARSFARRTIQPEIVSEERTLLRLQDVTGSSPIPLARLASRMGQVVLELHRDAGQSWLQLKVGEQTEWETRDDDVDRQAWYIERSAVRMLDGEPPGDPSATGIGALGWWTVARSMERIADHAVRIGEVGQRLGESVVPGRYRTSLEQFHGQALDYLSAVLDELREGSAAQANELLDTGEALRSVGRALSERLFTAVHAPAMPASTSIGLAQILESIDRTIAYTQDVAQVILDRPAGGASGPGPIPARPSRAPLTRHT